MPEIIKLRQRNGFRTNELVVYPAHGVGQIVSIEEGKFAKSKLELFVIEFEKARMTVRVPTEKSERIGMRKLSEDKVVTKALTVLKSKASVGGANMWNRIAPSYEAKINSGRLVSIAEVVRELYRSRSQPHQSYEMRQMYEAALDRMASEVAAVHKLDYERAIENIEKILDTNTAHTEVAA